MYRLQTLITVWFAKSVQNSFVESVHSVCLFISVITVWFAESVLYSIFNAQFAKRTVQFSESAEIFQDHS